jgi:hypothetical protein
VELLDELLLGLATECSWSGGSLGGVGLDGFAQLACGAMAQSLQGRAAVLDLGRDKVGKGARHG